MSCHASTWDSDVRKCVKKWAVHKDGTDQLGCLCSFKEEAEEMLADLHRSILHMPEEDRKKFRVVEVEVSWNE